MDGSDVGAETDGVGRYISALPKHGLRGESSPSLATKRVGALVAASTKSATEPSHSVGNAEDNGELGGEQALGGEGIDWTGDGLPSPPSDAVSRDDGFADPGDWDLPPDGEFFEDSDTPVEVPEVPKASSSDDVELLSLRRKMRSKGHCMIHYPAIKGCPGCDAKARQKRHGPRSFDRTDPRYAQYVTAIRSQWWTSRAPLQLVDTNTPLFGVR